MKEAHRVTDRRPDSRLPTDERSAPSHRRQPTTSPALTSFICSRWGFRFAHGFATTPAAKNKQEAAHPKGILKSGINFEV
jgi:hypothetical protein